MFTVIKRNGDVQDFHVQKIESRLKKLTFGLAKIDVAEIARKVAVSITDKIRVVDIDNLAAETAAYMCTVHPDYSILAARISISNLHKQTKKRFSDVASQLFHAVRSSTGKPCPLLSAEVYETIQEHAQRLDAAIVNDRDFEYDYFGFKTLERAYLMRIDDAVVERPQHMLMRVAVGIHGCDVDRAIETYDMMSRRVFTHATPTLFNAGTDRPQMSSCFLLTMQSDTLKGIYSTLMDCATISKYAGGIGLAAHNIRAKGSFVASTNGNSNGLVPMLRVFDATARYVDQGGGKRKGSFAIYLEPWHADIMEYLELRKNRGKEECRARDLFYALWIPDLFMKRVESGGTWTLFCPNEAQGLHEVYGDEFEALYDRYCTEGLGRVTINAQDLWKQILDSQMETGTPYMLYKDACNAKSNQKNLGVIKSSNLCTEIVQYTSPEETAVCNLASINLNAFVSAETQTFDFEGLLNTAKILVRNLNRVIDRNFYPIETARVSNMRHRPIGMGVQGFADALVRMRFPYESEDAKKLNRDIFQTIYYGAVEASMELAMEYGPYKTFKGSPMSRGEFQFDMWGVTPSKDMGYDWDALREKVVAHGVRNSLLVATMPTASTSQIMGNNESFEPFTSNIYSRRVLAGDFMVVNKHLVGDLMNLGIWTPELKNEIVQHRGSIQAIEAIPQDIRELYKTVWEIKQRCVIDMAADRGAYIDQSQSMNIFMADASHQKLTSVHFYGWRRGLKTGMYYLRTQPKAHAIQFTVDKPIAARLEKVAEKAKYDKKAIVCEVKEGKEGREEKDESSGSDDASSESTPCPATPEILSTPEVCIRRIVPDRTMGQIDGGEEEACLSCGS